MRADTDARVWASSIGATTIDIRDRAVMPTRPLKAPLIKTETLAELRKLLDNEADARRRFG